MAHVFSGAAVLIRPGSVRTPHNWMKVKEGLLVVVANQAFFWYVSNNDLKTCFCVVQLTCISRACLMHFFLFMMLFRPRVRSIQAADRHFDQCLEFH